MGRGGGGERLSGFVVRSAIRTIIIPCDVETGVIAGRKDRIRYSGNCRKETWRRCGRDAKWRERRPYRMSETTHNQDYILINSPAPLRNRKFIGTKGNCSGRQTSGRFNLPSDRRESTCRMFHDNYAAPVKGRSLNLTA